MGNCCGKESSDNFQGPGRTLGSAPQRPANAKASVPASVGNTQASKQPKVTGPGRTVGGAATAGTGGAASGDDPRSAAAAAAERRASKPTGQGDLYKKLEAQKKQTHNQTLQAAADENRMQREADVATETRNWH